MILVTSTKLEIYTSKWYTIAKNNLGDIILVKRIDVMNVELDNYSMREAMLLVETFLNNTVLNTIEEVTLRMVMQAENDDIVEECIQTLDIAVPGQKEIFEGKASKDLLGNRFFYEFAKRVIRGKKTVFLLGKKEEDLQVLRRYLEHGYERLQIVGESFLEKYSDDAGVINEINIQAPDVILSVIPSPEQEHFIMEQKGRLHAKVWYGMNSDYLSQNCYDRLRRKVVNLIEKITFKY